MSFATKPLALAFAGLLLTAPVALAQAGGGNEMPANAGGGMSNGSMGGGSMSKGSMSKGSMMKGGMKHHSMKHHSMKKKHKMM